jgi:hypothetical protein
MFLIRMAFWLIILILLLPTNGQQRSEIYGTAQAAVKDVSGFCDRNPSVCATGKDAFAVFVEKAQFGASLLMSFIEQETGTAAGTAEAPTDADSAASEAAGEKHSSLDQAVVAQAAPQSWGASTVTVEPASVESIHSQNTLNPRDLAPVWSGPRNAGI